MGAFHLVAIPASAAIDSALSGFSGSPFAPDTAHLEFNRSFSQSPQAVDLAGGFACLAIFQNP